MKVLILSLFLFSNFLYSFLDEENNLNIIRQNLKNDEKYIAFSANDSIIVFHFSYKDFCSVPEEIIFKYEAVKDELLKLIMIEDIFL